MADYTNFINQTGLNPFTGEKVDEGTALMAKHFQTVRGVSQTSAIISAAIGVFSEMVVKDSASSTPNYREQVLKNIEESKAARNSSKFNKYLEIESKTKTKIAEQLDFADDIARRTNGFNHDTATNAQKGNYGEIKAYEDLAKPKIGNELRRVGREIPENLKSPLEKGIDGIYINEGDSRTKAKVLIDEAKYNTSELNPKTNDGKQMSREWIEKRIYENDFDNFEDYYTVQRAIDKGNYDSVLSKIDIDGNVTHFRLDDNANIISDWP